MDDEHRERPREGSIAADMRASAEPRSRRQPPAGRILFPAFPLGRWAPAVLGLVALAVLITGLATGDGATALLGAVGLAGVIVAFPLARLLTGAGAAHDADERADQNE